MGRWGTRRKAEGGTGKMGIGGRGERGKGVKGERVMGIGTASPHLPFFASLPKSGQLLPILNRFSISATANFPELDCFIKLLRRFHWVVQK